MQYRYQITYRHPRTGAGGVIMLYAALETAAERSRLEALGYVVIDAPLPIEETQLGASRSNRDLLVTGHFVSPGGFRWVGGLIERELAAGSNIHAGKSPT